MGRRRALLIGNSVYDHSTFPALMKAEADIHALARVLSNPDIGGFEVTSFINKRVGTLLQKMERFFLQSERDDFLLFYFSGHGELGQSAASKSDYLYLIGKDTPPDFFSSRTITSSFLRELMDRSRARTQVLILDCCYSGAFLTKGRSQLGAEIVPLFGRGHAVLTSSSSSQQAWVGDDTIPLSLFTHYLVEGLETGVADKGKKGWITLDEWFDYAYKGVVNETSKQTPGKSIEKQHGSIVIAKNPTRPPKQLLSPQESHPSATQPQPHLLSHLMSQIETAYKAQDWSDVLRKAAHVLKHTSEDLPATFYLWYANALHQTGKPKKAQGAFERALVLVTDQAQRLEILLPYATLLLSQRRWNEVLALTDEALRLVPQDASWLQIKQKALGQGKTREEWWQDAETFRKQLQHERALTAYDQTIQLDPNDAAAYNNKGVFLQNLGRYQEAVDAFEQAIRLNPNDANAYNNKGNTLNRLGRYQEAIDAFEQAIRLNPNDANAYNNKGNTLQNLGRDQDAIAAYDQAIQLNPNDAELYYMKGQRLQWKGFYQYAEGVS